MPTNSMVNPAWVFQLSLAMQYSASFSSFHLREDVLFDANWLYGCVCFTKTLSHSPSSELLPLLLDILFNQIHLFTKRLRMQTSVSVWSTLPLHVSAPLKPLSIFASNTYWPSFDNGLNTLRRPDADGSGDCWKDGHLWMEVENLSAQKESGAQEPHKVSRGTITSEHFKSPFA